MPRGGGFGDVTLSRRQLLAGAGATVLGATVAPRTRPPGAGRRSPVGSPTRRYRSRPDLRPPVVTVTSRGAPTERLAFVTPGAPMIVDAMGTPVWFHPVPHAATNLRVQRFRGERVLTWWEGTVTKWGTGTGVGKIVDAGYRTVATVRCGNGLSADVHEFLLSDHTSAYLTAVDAVTADLRVVGGPKEGRLSRSYVQEVDVASGAVLFEWNSADHIPLEETMSRWHPKVNATKPFSAVHLNSVDVLDDGALLLSARNTWALYKVDTASGKIRWRLGGKASDFDVAKDARFAWQHDATWHRDGTISLFDDEASPKVRPQSRALFLAVDEAARRVEVTRAYTHAHPHLSAGSQGSVQLLPDGEVLVGWGSEPYFTRFGSAGGTRFDAKIEKGTSYRAYEFAWVGTPPDAPAIAVGVEAGVRLVYASWNGATGVARWEVLAGQARRSLAVAGSAPRRGFETAIPVAGSPAWVSARALDAGGTVLATAAPIRVT